MKEETKTYEEGIIKGIEESCEIILDTGASKPCGKMRFVELLTILYNKRKELQNEMNEKNKLIEQTKEMKHHMIDTIKQTQIIESNTFYFQFTFLSMILLPR